MKCFLISPDYPQKHALLLPVPPQGLAYVGAVLKSLGHQVEAEDQFASGRSNEDLVRRVMDFSPDLVGIGCLTPTMSNSAELSRLLRKRGFQGVLIMGGVHPTLFYQSILDEGLADVVVLGESEKTLPELMSAIENHAPLESVAGLAFRDQNGLVVKTKDRPQNRNLDDLPYPAWHLFDLARYSSAPLLALYGLALPVQASRGCPERCTFCGQEIFYPKMAFRSIPSVLGEIDELVDRYKMKYFVFVDANFPPSKKYGLDFCAAFTKSRHWPKVKWCCEIKVDMVDEELLRAMKEAGCHLIEYGLEVGDSKILKSLKKRTTLEDGIRAMNITRKVGIHTLGLFMIGLPGEGVREIIRTFRFARKIRCDMAKFNIAIPQPGSELFRRHQDRLLADFHPQTYSSWYRPGKGEPPMTTLPGGLPVKLLQRLQTLGMLWFYARPGFIFRQLRQGTLPLKDMVRGAGFLLSEALKL
ncbi:MAG: radical SAM protein [Thermodesulfobacteriota bacterium]